MTQKMIGALTIGQSPRPDLVAPLEILLPKYRILQAGALDDITIKELPPTVDSSYPLVTKMRNDVAVMVDESFVAPKLQKGLVYLEERGVAATVLLCAGTFIHLKGKRPFFKPYEIGCGFLSAIDVKSIGLIVPFAEQETPVRRRWGDLGWQTSVWIADLGNQDKRFHQQLAKQIQTNSLDCIVLDYVGHPSDQVSQLKKSINLPVVDLGHLAMVTLASTL